MTALDDHELEVRAMALFRQGEGKAASALQDEFPALVRASGEDHCSCPSARKFHGMGRALRGLAVCMVLGVAAGRAGEAGQGLPDWREITAAATVVASLGADKPLEGFAPSVLRDGSVAPPSTAVGSANLNAEFHLQFAWSAFESRWEWPQPQAIAAIDLLVAEPLTDHAAPVCVKVLALDAHGQYTVRLYHNENLVWQPAVGWQDAQAPAQKAQTVRLALTRPYLTKGLRIVVGHQQKWVELGDVRIWASTATLPVVAVPPPLTANQIRLWSDTPWADTEGGTKPPAVGADTAPWALTVCRRDTEQALIGLLNSGPDAGSVTVGVSGAPAWLGVELHAVGAVEARGTTAEWWAVGKSHVALLNLFTAEQVRSFGGHFPKHFPDVAAWQDFPTLRLLPGKPAYVWLKLTTAAEAPPGDVKLEFSAGPRRRELTVRVLNVRLPAVRKDQILVEIWDEPNDANIDSWLLMAKEIKAYDPTALIYANPPEDWEGHPCTLAKTVQPMAPYVDVWAPHLNLINQFPDTLVCMKATGKPIWFYQNVGLAY